MIQTISSQLWKNYSEIRSVIQTNPRAADITAIALVALFVYYNTNSRARTITAFALSGLIGCYHGYYPSTPSLQMILYSGALSVPAFFCAQKVDEFLFRRKLGKELEQALDAWINNSEATGNKEEAAKRIMKAFQEKLDELYLNSLDLNCIPDIIGNLHHLEWLNLGHNNLSTLPDTIGSLQNLRELCLDENGLRTIPDTIGKLHHLEWLDLGHNNLSTLPDTIGSLQNLRELCLDENGLRTIPDTIGNLQNLRRLDLDKNGLSTIPDTIGNLGNLQKLFLTSNKLNAVPATIGNLQNLRRLDLDKNGLSTIPDTIGNLHYLEWLNLGNNNLSTIPVTIDNLKNLEVLFLINNDLRFIPTSIGDCLGLKAFMIAGNKSLQDLPMSMGNIPNLMLIIQGASIPQERVDAILAMCKATREREAEERLLQQLELWCSYASINSESLDAVLNYTYQEKIAIYDWLFRLSNCSDFSNNQKGLAEIACAILLDTTQNPTFKETFIAQIIANNARCGDRAAMGLNVLYVSWCILCPKKEISLKQQLELLAKAGKTLALREALGKQVQEYELANPESLRESTEIYLYYETHLKDSLGLLTAVETMLYKDIGRRDWVDVEQLKSEIQKNYLDQVVSLPIFEQLLEGDSTAVVEMEKIKKDYASKLEAENSNIDLIAKEREEKLKIFKKHWLLAKLKTE